MKGKLLSIPINNGQRYQSRIFKVVISKDIPDIAREILPNTLVSAI